MAPRPCWGSGMGLGHDNGLTLAGERFGAREKSQANQNREKTAATLWPHFCVHSHISNYGGGQKTAAVFPGFETVAKKYGRPPCDFSQEAFPEGPREGSIQEPPGRRRRWRPRPKETRLPREATRGFQPGNFRRASGSLLGASENFREPPGASGSF